MKQSDLCPYATLFAAVLLALAPVRAKADNHPGSKPAVSTEAVAATQPTTRPFTLTTDDAGRLVLTPLQPGKVTLGGGRYWPCEDGKPVALDCYSPRGNYWSGHVSVHLVGDVLTLWGGREVYTDWMIREFTLQQTPSGVTAEFIVRTPIGQPDITVKRSDRHTATLLLRHPELLPMLDHVLVGIGASTYDPGPFVRAQLSGDLAVSDETRARVAELVRLGGAAEWRTREKAGNALAAMGVDGAIALLGLRDLSPAERQAVDVCLSGWPVIERRDRLTAVTAE